MMKISFGQYRNVPLLELLLDSRKWLHSIDLREPLAPTVLDELDQREACRVIAHIVTTRFPQLATQQRTDRGGTHDSLIEQNSAHEWLRERLGV